MERVGTEYEKRFDKIRKGNIKREDNWIMVELKLNDVVKLYCIFPEEPEYVEDEVKFG